MTDMRNEGKSAFWGQVGALARKLGNTGAAPPPAVPARAAPRPPPTPADPLLAFARRVRAVLGDGATASAGAIYIVNLSKVRQLLMDEGRWDRLADRVQSICLQMIRQRLDPADLFHSLPGPIFLIVFARLSLEAAKLKCAAIAEEIGQRLTGCDPKFKDVMVGAAMAGLGKDDIALNLTYLMAEAERVIADGPAAVVADLAPEGAATAAPRRAFDNPWLVEDRAAGVKAAAVNDWYYDETPECPPDLSFVYLPLWHVKHRAIATFLCLPVLPVSPSQSLVGDAIFATAPAAVLCELDIALLRKVAGDLELLLADGKHATLSLPVHFETLAQRTQRKRYMSVCVGLNEGLRRHLAFELVDLPEDAPAGRVAELLSYVRPFARLLSVRTTLSQVQFDTFGAAKVSSVGVAVGRETLSESQLLSRMNCFTKAANRAGLHTYAFELRTHSITAAALGAGFDYISGQMIGSIVDAPDAAYHFDVADLYAGLLGEA